MKKRGRSIALLLVLVMCLAMLASCSGSGNGSDNTGTPETSTSQGSSPSIPTSVSTPPAAPPDDPEVRYAEHLEINTDLNNIATLNPFSPAANNTSTNWAFNLIHDKLVYYSVDGQYLPSLATEWETDDWQNFTFHLRDDVYFHNGDHFTAEDIAWTVEAAREGVGSSASDQWRSVENVIVVDPYTVKFELSQVNVDFLANVSMPMAFIVNKRAMTEDPEAGTQIGTGAYYVTSFAPNDSVNLARNDNYWGEPPITKTLSLRFIPEMGTRAIMMQSGELQASFGISAEELFLFEEDSDNFDVYPVTLQNPQAIIFNMNDPIASDYNFRMAVAMAVDRAQIADVVAGKWAVPETEGTLWGFATEFRNHDIPIIPYDIEKAKEYLELSPYNGEVLEVSAGNVAYIKTAEMLQIQLEAIGVKIEIRQFDTPGLATYVNSPEFKSSFIVNPALTSISASSIRTLYYTGSPMNRSKYSNPVIDKMFDEAATMTDVKEREAMYKSIQEIIAEDPPMINLYWRLDGRVFAKGIGGFVLPPDVHRTDMRYIYMILDD